MIMKRSGGILLHPTSLPGTPGIGTIGKNAYAFVDWLVKARQSLWQILPTGPTGYGDSPYASFSTFAGNPLLIDLDNLVQRGFLTHTDIAPPDFISSSGYIDYGSVVWWKIPVLAKAAENFLSSSDTSGEHESYTSFVHENDSWLSTFALYMSIKNFFDKKAASENVKNPCWNYYWPDDLASCSSSALENWYKNNTKDVDTYKVIQYLFFSQWRALKKYAAQKGISIIGDIPIFVAPDSADVWANQHLFQLDKKRRPKAVSGVPPDYFSADGQLWGNPLYNWKAMKDENYAWWTARIKAALTMTDYVRIDHFRGFEAYWSVPAGEKTAVNGKWIKGPDHALFKSVREQLGDVPIIAEDLGVITDSVARLRDDFELPGMKVLQFAFDYSELQKGSCVNAFLPHMYTTNRCVVYTGTHDNDTTAGWFSGLSWDQQRFVREYCGAGEHEDICRAFIRQAYASTAAFAVVPLQDIYGLGSEARLNTPSTAGGHNWQWRMTDNMLQGTEAQGKASMLSHFTALYGRAPECAQ